jgi:ubiquinone/menaquinone biosynthesis C-methylase UbiE
VSETTRAIGWPNSADPAAAIEKWLVSPASHQPVHVADGAIRSADPAFQGSIRDGVAVMMNATQPSFFDDKYEVMQEGHEREGERTLCYAQQTALFSSYLQAGQVVLDVGCGPSLPYERVPGITVVGLEPSFQSIRANRSVDLKVCGSATAIPMADASVDIVVCFYSIHHMVGASRSATEQNVALAFREFGRVLKPGGHLFVFEMTPLTLFSWAQRLVWNTLRRIAPRKLDMYFWSAEQLAAVGRDQLPVGTVLEKIFFGASAFTIIPPAFSLPWLRVPRLIYPLDAKLYKWRVAKPRP